MQENGYVLAGGQSRRMGQDKSLLLWRGRPLVERALSLLASLQLKGHIVCASSAQARRHRAPTLIDTLPGRGPMGGILSGLRHASSPRSCFVPCDMPLLSRQVLESLRSYSDDFDVVVPGDRSGLPQPVVGYYSVDCIQALEKRLHQCRLSLTELLRSSEVRVKIVPGLENAFGREIFLNINDPEVLAQTQGTEAGTDQDSASVS